MAGEVLKFPRPERDNSGERERELAFNVREPKILEKFDLGNSQDLLGVSQRIISGCRALLDFIHSNRDLARQAGIETIAIEITSSLESEGFERVIDALEEAAAEGKPVHLSTEGLGRIRRMESLLAEASSNINRFTHGGHRLAEAAHARADREAERNRLRLQVATQRLEALREKYQIRNYAAGQEVMRLSGTDQDEALKKAQFEAERRQTEIDIAEKKLASLRDEYRAQNYAAHREADILAGIDTLNDAELAQAAPIGPKSTPGMTSNALLWGSVIAFGAVAVTLVIIAAASKDK